GASGDPRTRTFRWVLGLWAPAFAGATAERDQSSARQHDEVGAVAGLGAEALVGDNQRGAGRHQLGDLVKRILGDVDAIECFGRVGGGGASALAFFFRLP